MASAQEQKCQLEGLHNACELPKCVYTIIDGNVPENWNHFYIWILYLNDGTTYNTTPMTVCRLHFWDETSLYAASYNYQQWVYVNVVRTLVDKRVCPLFTRYLAHGKRCDVRTLQEIVLNSQGNGGITPIIKSGGSRTYGLLLLEDVRASSDLKNYFDDHDELTVKEWGILLHIAIACYALFLAKTAHNNLIAGNVKLVKNVQVTTFKINGEKYTIQPVIEPIIINFLSANVLRYKPNPLKDTNTIIETHDFFTILKDFHSHYNDDRLIRVLSQESLEEISSNMHNHEWRARKLYSLPVVIGNIYQHCSRVEHCDNEFNCSSVLFEEDGRFKRSNKLNDLTLQKLEQARLERSLSPSQKEVADLEKAVSDDNNAINKARDVHEGLKYKQKALDADNELVMQRLSRLKSADQQFAQHLEAVKKECKDAQLDNMMFKSLLVASTVGVATAAYMKFGKKDTLKGKNK